MVAKSVMHSTMFSILSLLIFANLSAVEEVKYIHV